MEYKNGSQKKYVVRQIYKSRSSCKIALVQRVSLVEIWDALLCCSCFQIYIFALPPHTFSEIHKNEMKRCMYDSQ